MALSIQIPYRGDEYLFQGISQAGRSLGDSIDQMAERLKQTKAMRTMAIDGLGMDKEKVNAMKLPELQGHLQGAALKQQREQQAQHAQESDLHMQLYRQQIEAAKAAEARTRALEGFSGDFARGNVQPMQPPGFSDLQEAGGAGGMNPPSMMYRPVDQRMLWALGRNPSAAAAPQFDNTLQALIRGGRTAQAGIAPWSLGNMHGGINPQTGKTFYDLETEAALAKAKAAGHTDKILQRTPDVPEGGNIEQAKDKAGKDIPGLYHVLDGKGKKTSMWFNPHSAGGHSQLDAFMDIMKGAGNKTETKPGDPLGIFGK